MSQLDVLSWVGVGLLTVAAAVLAVVFVVALVKSPKEK